MELMTSLGGKEIYFYLYFCSPHFCKIGNLKDKQGFFFARNELSTNSVKVLTFQKKRRKLLPPLYSHDQKVWNINRRKSITFSFSPFLAMTVCVLDLVSTFSLFQWYKMGAWKKFFLVFKQVYHFLYWILPQSGSNRKGKLYWVSTNFKKLVFFAEGIFNNTSSHTYLSKTLQTLYSIAQAFWPKFKPALSGLKRAISVITPVYSR